MKRCFSLLVAMALAALCACAPGQPQAPAGSQSPSQPPAVDRLAVGDPQHPVCQFLRLGAPGVGPFQQEGALPAGRPGAYPLRRRRRQPGGGHLGLPVAGAPLPYPRRGRGQPHRKMGQQQQPPRCHLGPDIGDIQLHLPGAPSMDSSSSWSEDPIFCVPRRAPTRYTGILNKI